MTSMFRAIWRRTSSRESELPEIPRDTPQLQSSCSTIPALTMASYSTRMASAMATSNSSGLE